ncbi:MAG: NFACT family protein [Oscillospiraceae bacterium]|nr:NFACT family protein [Oscillospiraceae bacterium]MBQ5468369.1 NFACT family protein [Oscillospiraceae bacterium]
MPLDAIFLTALTAELNETLPGSRIDKIQQPDRETVLLSLRTQGAGNRRLLLSASPNHPRIHYTAEKFEQPAQPPMFCMLLRKHLSGGRILSLTQLPMERAVDLCIESADELGELSRKHIWLELMGRNSNLILTGPDGRILDCLRRVDFEMSEKRQVLPGLFYREPPTQGKLDLRAETPEALQAELERLRTQTAFDGWLMDRYAGISPLIARELVFRLTGSVEADLSALEPADLAPRLCEALHGLLTGFAPTLLLRGETPKDFSFRPIAQYEGWMTCRTAAGFSALLDDYYAERDRTQRIKARTQNLTKTLNTLKSRAERKLANQRKELEATYDRERLRQLGDIVTANLHRIDRGQARLTAVDFYDPEMREIEIPLNAAISPQQNAAKLYKDYNKAKHAEKFLTGQIAAGETEVEYLTSVLDALSRAETERDVSDIRTELIEGGYLRSTDRKKQMKTQPARPLEFRSSDGFQILVGRNNRQNDLLTAKMAYKTDLWLHVQKSHGSHVIIACAGAQVPDRTITEAAMLAGWYSEARQGQNVPVDLCPVRQVKKPAGAKPGMVVYENYRTVYITPDPELPGRLSRREP